MLDLLEPAQRKKMERLSSLRSTVPEPVKAVFLLLDYFPETLHAYMQSLHKRWHHPKHVPFRYVIAVLSDVAEVRVVAIGSTSSFLPCRRTATPSFEHDSDVPLCVHCPLPMPFAWCRVCGTPWRRTSCTWT
jgi:hypothetical protein